MEYKETILTHDHLSYYRPSMVSMRHEMQSEAKLHEMAMQNRDQAETLLEHTSIYGEQGDLTLVDIEPDRHLYICKRLQELGKTAKSSNISKLVLYLGIEHKLLVHRRMVTDEFLVNFDQEIQERLEQHQAFRKWFHKLNCCRKSYQKTDVYRNLSYELDRLETAKAKFEQELHRIELLLRANEKHIMTLCK